MLLTITTTHQPATDLGYLLHKNPARAQRFALSFGAAYVVYPEASAERCTVALVLDVDPVGLVRGRRGPEGNGGLLTQYVNDRPYVASSFLSVAMSEVFGTAMSGRSKERPDLADTLIPLEVRLATVPCRGGEEFLRRLFEPLGYAVRAEAAPLDPVSRRNADGGEAAERSAHPPLRARTRAGRREALLGGRRRGGEADPARRGVARVASGEGADHAAIPQTSAFAGTRRGRTVGHRRVAGRRRRRASGARRGGGIARAAAQPQRATARHGPRRPPRERCDDGGGSRVWRRPAAPTAARRPAARADRRDGRVVPCPRDRPGPAQARPDATDAA